MSQSQIYDCPSELEKSDRQSINLSLKRDHPSELGKCDRAINISVSKAIAALIQITMNLKYAANKSLVMSNSYKIEAFWDQEAEVWVAESQNIWGLVTEADTLDQLTHKLKQVIPDLLIANHQIVQNPQQSIAFGLIAHRQELIQVA